MSTQNLSLDKNGYSVHGASFSNSNFGKPIEAQGQFIYKNHIISFSTQENFCKNQVLIMDINQEDLAQCHSVEDAINWVDLNVVI